MIPVAIENTRLKLSLSTPSRIPIILAKEITDSHPLVADEITKTLST